MRFINHKSHTRKCADAPIVGQARQRLKNIMQERSAYMVQMNAAYSEGANVQCTFGGVNHEVGGNDCILRSRR